MEGRNYRMQVGMGEPTHPAISMFVDPDGSPIDILPMANAFDPDNSYNFMDSVKHSIISNTDAPSYLMSDQFFRPNRPRVFRQ
jgi:hypothetical protein